MKFSKMTNVQETITESPASEEVVTGTGAGAGSNTGTGSGTSSGVNAVTTEETKGQNKSNVQVVDVTLQTSDASPQSPQPGKYYNHPGPGPIPGPPYYPYQHQHQINHNHNQAPNSPSSISLGNGGYHGIQSLLATQVPGGGTAVFGTRQQYNNVPPLSPAMRDINNNEANLNLPPASPLFPGAVPLYSTSSEQVDTGVGGAGVMNGASMFASTTSPTFQYLTGPPPSPVVSYGYPPSIPNSPEARNSWTDRYVYIAV
jgi:hypothetical protein